MKPPPGLVAVLILLAGCARPQSALSPHPDRELQRVVERLTAGFPGVAGAYVRHLRTGAVASVRADELFPTASMVKVPILATLYERVEAGALRLDTVLTFADSLRYTDEDVLGEFREGATISLAELTYLVATVSDNSAALWIQALVGGGAAVNGWLAREGFDSTRVNSRTAGRRPNWEVHGWGQTTPREMAELLVRIRDGRVAGPARSRELYRLLTKNISGSEGTAPLPLDVQVATKEGAVDRSRSQALLVNAPHGDYVLVVITRELQDSSWTPDNPGWVLIRDLSTAVWNHFEPHSR